MSKSCGFVCLLVVAVFSSLSFAVTPDRISGALTTGPTVTLRGNVHHKALPQYDQGPADPSTKLAYMTLLTKPTASQSKALQVLLAQQQDPKSPNYHRWLTPEQWADRFGLSPADIQKITKWLAAQGFTVGNIARGRNWITFSGTVAQVESAFGTQIRRYNVNDEVHVANATAPKIPAALSGIVTGIRGLHDFHLRPRSARRDFAARPYYNSSNFGDLVAPGDIATIYDINALYNASTAIDGTGQKLAIIGQTDVYLADLTNFRTGFGMAAISCTTNTGGLVTACSDAHLKYVLVPNAPDPGTPLAGDLSEADLDLEWSSAVARNAQLVYVNAPAVFNTSGGLVSGGVWDAWYYAVDNDLAPVLSLSYGFCEFDDNNITDPNSGLPAADEIELQKANSEGITFVNSSGDFGAAECDFAGTGGTLTASGLATQGIAVGYPASSPEVTGVGGSAIPFANFTSTYWGAANGTDGGTALSYIPEQAWNDDDEIGQFCQQNPSNSFCSGNRITDALSAQGVIGVSSTGGGASNCAMQDPTFSTCVAGFAQPTWQTVSLPNQPSARFSPDVSLLASPNFPGYIFCTQLSEVNVSGTGSSCNPGGSAGIANALNLTDKNGHTTGSIIGGTSASAPLFAGIVTLLNQYMNGSSPAGLGNINPMLYALAQTTSNGAFNPVTASSNQVYCQANTPSTQPYTLQCPVTGLLGFLGSSADTTTSYNLVTGLGSVDANKLAVALKAMATQAGFTLSPSSTSLTAAVGANSNQVTITITPQNGFVGTVTFTCSGLPSGATCNIPSTSTAATTLSITAASNMASVQNASVVVTGTSGGASSSTAVNLTVTGGSQSFTLQSSLGSSGTLSLVRGAQGTVNLGISSTTGFVTTTGGNAQTALPVTYSCTGLPSESTCAFSPASPTSAATLTLTLSTTAPTSKASARFSPGSRLFYAALLPGIFGIVLTLGSRKRSVRSLRILGFILVLGCSTMWISSCGGSGGGGGGGGNPGTPTGNYTITVNATTSGPSSSTSFTLSVN